MIEKYYRRLLDSVPSGLAVTDKNLKVVYTNAAFRALFPAVSAKGSLGKVVGCTGDAKKCGSSDCVKGCMLYQAFEDALYSARPTMQRVQLSVNGEEGETEISFVLTVKPIADGICMGIIDDALQTELAGELRSANIKVQNLAAFDALAKALNNDNLRKIEARDVAIRFEVRDGRVHTSPFDLKLGDVTTTLSGSTGLDQTIDYTARVTIPGGQALETLDVNIGGTFTDPKITLGVKEAVEQAVKNVVDEQVQKLTGSESLSEEIERQAENLRAEAKKAGERLVEEAQKQSDKLVEEAAKKGALAKLAAQKAGEKLVEEARKQAANLEAEAERQIEKLTAQKE